MKFSSKIIGFLGAGILALGVLYVTLSRPVIIPVDITSEQRADYEEKVKLYDEKIKTEVDEEDQEKRPRMDDFIEKARYQGYLGRLSDSETTLKTALSYYEVSSIAHHNLAKLYEQMKLWKRAFKLYAILVTDYQKPEYEWDMARMAKEMNDVKLASKHYWSYQRQFKNPSAEFEQWLREKKAK